MAEQVAQLSDNRSGAEHVQLGNSMDGQKLAVQLAEQVQLGNVIPLKPLVWEDSVTRLLIVYYRENPCLYDVASKEYQDRDLKRKVVDEIAMKLGTSSEFV